MDYTFLQIPADRASVVDALTTLAPLWSDHAAVEHTGGWTAVPVEARTADRFAPLLADLLARGILVWTVDSGHCRVRHVRANGDAVEAVDDDATQVARFADAFGQGHVLVSYGDQGDDSGEKRRETLVAVATDPARTPAERQQAFAELLGVPGFAPTHAPTPLPTTPALSQASTSQGDREFRRRQRIRTARSWLHLLSGLGLVAVIGGVIRGYLLVAGGILLVVGLLQVVRFVLGRGLEQPARYR